MQGKGAEGGVTAKAGLFLQKGPPNGTGNLEAAHPQMRETSPKAKAARQTHPGAQIKCAPAESEEEGQRMK